MPDRFVASYAGDFFIVVFKSFHHIYNILVAFKTRIVGYINVVLLYFNIVGIPSCCKIKGMPETIRCFDIVFCCSALGSMTIVAYGSGTMARFYPAIELGIHTVTICTGLRIVCYIRISFRVKECIYTDAQEQSGIGRGNNKYFSVKEKTMC